MRRLLITDTHVEPQFWMLMNVTAPGCDIVLHGAGTVEDGHGDHGLSQGSQSGPETRGPVKATIVAKFGDNLGGASEALTLYNQKNRRGRSLDRRCLLRQYPTFGGGSGGTIVVRVSARKNN